MLVERRSGAGQDAEKSPFFSDRDRSTMTLLNRAFAAAAVSPRRRPETAKKGVAVPYNKRGVGESKKRDKRGRRGDEDHNACGRSTERRPPRPNRTLKFVYNVFLR